MTAPLRYLLFGTERYALPILAPLARAIVAAGERYAWCLPGVASATGDDAPRLPSMAAVRDYAPHAVLCAANVVPPQFPGLKAQLFHGFSVDKRSRERGHYRIRGLFDLYCTQGPDTTEPFQALAARHGYFRVVETGWSKLDPMFDGSLATEVAALRAPAAARAVVAFGSTFTERLSAAPHLFDAIAALVAQGTWYWLLTLHPKCEESLRARYRALAGANAAFVESEGLPAMLAAADVLVADTSSIVPEFLVQRRPAVTFRYRLPGPQLLQLDDAAALEATLQQALLRPAPLMQAIGDYAARVHPARDGRSSARVLAAVRQMLADGGAGLRRKPGGWWRGLQWRWRHGTAWA